MHVVGAGRVGRQGTAEANSTGCEDSNGAQEERRQELRGLFAPPGGGTRSAMEATGKPPSPSTELADQVLATSYTEQQ